MGGYMIDIDVRRLYLFILKEEYRARKIEKVNEAMIICLATKKIFYLRYNGRSKRKVGSRATVILKPKDWHMRQI
jgi:hypothetical protein